MSAVKYSLLSTFFFAGLCHLSAAQELSGKWEGFVTQKLWSSVYESPYRLHVVQKGNELSGVAYIEASEYLNLSAKMKFEGSLQGKKIILREVTMLEGDVMGNEIGWCMKTLKLTLLQKAGEDTMEGEWEGFDKNNPDQACTPGKVSLRRAFEGFRYLLLDQENKQLLKGQALVKEVGADKQQALQPDDEGEIAFLPLPEKSYKVIFSAKGYYDAVLFGQTRALAAETDDEVDVPMRKIKKGDIIVIDRIHFSQSSAALDPEAREKLDELAGFLRRYPGMVVEIAGHTSNEASTQLNQQLSELRAKEVAKYLSGKGVPGFALRPVGYGSSRPVTQETAPEERAKNRRVEFRVLQYKEPD